MKAFFLSLLFVPSLAFAIDSDIAPAESTPKTAVEANTTSKGICYVDIPGNSPGCPGYVAASTPVVPAKPALPIVVVSPAASPTGDAPAPKGFWWDPSKGVWTFGPLPAAPPVAPAAAPPPAAAAAAPPVAPAAGPPVAPVAPVAPVLNRADPRVYKVVKENEAMYDNQLSSEVTQAGAFTASENLLGSCVENSITGRKDGPCAKDPNHPECAGLNGATKNATNCLKYHPVKTTMCIEYGTPEFTMPEWLAFGSLYLNSSKACLDKRGDVKAKGKPLESLTEMAARTYGQGSGRSMGPFSDISSTGSSSATRLYSQESFEKMQDGSSSLGYDNGEFMRGIFSGRSFTDVVTESPFYKRLESYDQNKISETLTDPDSVVATLREGKIAEMDKERKEREEAAAEEETAATRVAGQNPSEASTISEASSSFAGTAAEAPPVFIPSVTVAAVEPEPAKGRWYTEEQILARRKLASINKISPTALNPLHDVEEPKVKAQSAPIEPEATTSLFERVHFRYQQRAGKMEDPFRYKGNEKFRNLEPSPVFSNL